MPLNMIKKEIEAEREIGYKYLQVLSRAETLVPGAGREAIEALLWDANAVIIRTDVQNDRVVLDGALNCQAVYRQGEETSLRALCAKANISQVTDIPGAQTGMLCRVQPVVENVDVRYENGHMVFQVSLGVHVRVLKLETLQIIEEVEGGDSLQLRFNRLCFTRLAAEATETAVFTERVELPQSLDARTTLMDWGSVVIDSSEPDLGGVRVKGRAQIETLVASGLEGRPAVLVKYPIEFDKLIELPEWLSQNACVTPSVRSIRTQLEQTPDDEEGVLLIQADVHFAIAVNLEECVNALEDAYATSGSSVMVQSGNMTFCRRALCVNGMENVRGSVLLDEGAPSVGSVIAVRALPNIAEVESADGKSIIRGILDAMVLYMPGGSDIAASTKTQMPFELELNLELGENPTINIIVASAEANALMSDRLEMKFGLNLNCESRLQQEYSIVQELQEGPALERRPGYVICWPDQLDDAWSIGKRYAIAQNGDLAAMEEKIARREALVLRI